MPVDLDSIESSSRSSDEEEDAESIASSEEEESSDSDSAGSLASFVVPSKKRKGSPKKASPKKKKKPSPKKASKKPKEKKKTPEKKKIPDFPKPKYPTKAKAIEEVAPGMGKHADLMEFVANGEIEKAKGKPELLASLTEAAGKLSPEEQAKYKETFTTAMQKYKEAWAETSAAREEHKKKYGEVTAKKNPKVVTEGLKRREIKIVKTYHGGFSQLVEKVIAQAKSQLLDGVVEMNQAALDSVTK